MVKKALSTPAKATDEPEVPEALSQQDMLKGMIYPVAYLLSFHALTQAHAADSAVGSTDIAEDAASYAEKAMERILENPLTKKLIEAAEIEQRQRQDFQSQMRSELESLMAGMRGGR